MAQDLGLKGTVVFVRDLSRSVKFYRDLLGLEVTDTSSTAALLSNGAGTYLILRATGSQMPPLGAVGVQYVVWSLPSQAELDRCEQMLRQRSAYRDTFHSPGVTSVEGHDPDGLEVMLTYAEEGTAPLRELPTRIYAW